MPPPRKKLPSSSSPTPTDGQSSIPAPPTENTKKKRTTFQLRAGIQRGFGSSGGITSSVTSFSRIPTPTPPNKPGSSKESGWKTAYGAARMAVEIAKESSDMLLPLKAVVGALSVLIKNYDVSSPRKSRLVHC